MSGENVNFIKSHVPACLAQSAFMQKIWRINLYITAVMQSLLHSFHKSEDFSWNFAVHRAISV